MRIQLFVALAIMTLLSGCEKLVTNFHDAAESKPMTIVITPGMLIDVDGQAAKVFGKDECPREETAMRLIFGPSSLDGSKDCLVIGPNTKSVEARVVLRGSVTEETWSVDRSGAGLSKVLLSRPGKQPVLAYQK